MSQRLRIAAPIAVVAGTVAFLLELLVVPSSATAARLAINVTMVLVIVLLPQYVAARRGYHRTSPRPH